MQLDNTRIAVRERGMLEVFDLSLHVSRAYLVPLVLYMALGVFPFFILNLFITSWMTDVNPADYDPWGVFFRKLRYVWWMSALVFLEAPLACAFATVYLGKAVFLERPRFAEIVHDVYKRAAPLAWSQLALRGVGLTVFLLLSVERNLDDWDPGVELFLLGGILCVAGILRAVRPFINEIILLEKNPWRTTDPQTISIGRRSSALHTPSGGDLFARFFAAAFLSTFLVFAVYATIRFIPGLFLQDWVQGVFPYWAMTNFFFPLAMWIVAGYFCVVRFLSYLDVRIRQEGWEVELGLRAEAVRLAQKKAVL